MAGIDELVFGQTVLPHLLLQRFGTRGSLARKK